MLGVNKSSHVENDKLICLSQKVVERISCLRRDGTAGAILADKAEAVISKLKSEEGWQPGRKMAPRTQYGEKRIRKCIKYDLGWGFRLITILRRSCLFICHLGPHDECDRWLADNSRIKNVDIGKCALYRIGPREQAKETACSEEFSEMPDDLDERLQKLSDQSLRRIFNGLVEARNKTTVLNQTAAPTKMPPCRAPRDTMHRWQLRSRRIGQECR